jgi:hypothetical protein
MVIRGGVYFEISVFEHSSLHSLFLNGFQNVKIVIPTSFITNIYMGAISILCL